jgi:hypothetical protein
MGEPESGVGGILEIFGGSQSRAGRRVGFAMFVRNCQFSNDFKLLDANSTPVMAPYIGTARPTSMGGASRRRPRRAPSFSDTGLIGLDPINQSSMRTAFGARSRPGAARLRLAPAPAYLDCALARERLHVTGPQPTSVLDPRTGSNNDSSRWPPRVGPSGLAELRTNVALALVRATRFREHANASLELGATSSGIACPLALGQVQGYFTHVDC